MKYLLVLAVVVVAFYIWRNNRREELGARQPPQPPRPGAPVTMVACRVCGTHLPQSEAVQGREGLYCSQEHRQRIEGPAG